MMDSLEEVPCNLCGASDSRVRFEAREGWLEGTGYFAATTDRFGAYGTIRQCRGCGLLYTSPRMNAAAIAREYELTEDEDYFSEGESRSMNAYIGLRVLRRHVRGGRLLDVGCSVGYFLHAARLSYEVAGVEPSRWARRYAREKLDLTEVYPTLEEAAFPAGSFDVVTLIDVIEHHPNPAGLIRELSRVTKPGGILYVVTPDIGSLSARLLGRRWWGLRPAHIYYFSRNTLDRILSENGFEPIWARSYGRIFTWGYWLSRLENYPRFVQWAVGHFVRALDIQDKFLYLDTRDSVQVVARRTGQ
jgi:SAM-dependent methyltransferase